MWIVKDRHDNECYVYPHSTKFEAYKDAAEIIEETLLNMFQNKPISPDYEDVFYSIEQGDQESAVDEWNYVNARKITVEEIEYSPDNTVQDWKNLQKKILKALDYAKMGQNDDNAQWAVDQMVRALCGSPVKKQIKSQNACSWEEEVQGEGKAYKEFIANFEQKSEYKWKIDNDSPKHTDIWIVVFKRKFDSDIEAYVCSSEELAWRKMYSLIRRDKDEKEIMLPFMALRVGAWQKDENEYKTGGFITKFKTQLDA